MSLMHNLERYAFNIDLDCDLLDREQIPQDAFNIFTKEGFSWFPLRTGWDGLSMRHFSSKRKGVSLQPKFSKDQPWKDLNKKKERQKGAAHESKWTVSRYEKGMEDSYAYFQSIYESDVSNAKSMYLSSFEDYNLAKPGQDDAWGFNSENELLSGSSQLFELSEPTQKTKQAGTKLKTYLKEHLIETDASEIILDNTFEHLSTNSIAATVKELGLHWQTYGTKKASIRVVSKLPLARYRAEFDPRTKSRHFVRIDPEIVDVVRLTLNSIKIQCYEEDWVEHPDDMKETVPEKEFEQDVKPSKSSLSLEDALKGRLGSSDEEDNEVFDELGAVSFRHTSARDLNEEEINNLRERQKEFLQTDFGKMMTETRQTLPTWKHKMELLDLIRKHQVVIISGETGCGKTTQLPQFILEDAIESGAIAKTNIICTQPRRISAMSVSQRVADERGESIGDLVGFQIRMSARRSSNTRLLFCTSGVLLRRLIGDRDLEDVSHIIVDEIHERGMNEDFLLIVLKNLLAQRPDLRVLLMSATMDSDTFSNYFSQAPVMQIPGFMYPVNEFFMEDVIEKTGYQISASDRHKDFKLQWYQKAKSLIENPAMLNYIPRQSDFVGYKESTFASIRTWASCSNEKLHYGLIEATIEHICRHEDPGGILVFLTSWDDIQTMMDLLQSNPTVGNASMAKILPLHSTLASISQEEIFKKPPPGIRKIVLATNIAETSITINDIVYVINPGKAKEKSYDPLNKIACLFPTWISKASCTQRKGRAGRVQPGNVYHLFPRSMHEECFIEHQMPEIMRTPLAELCLQIKSLGLGSMQEFMACAMNPPSPQTVNNAILQLKSIGAIDTKQELTPLGRHLAHLPVEPTLGKMILMGAIFGCLDPCLTLAAASTVKDPFQRPVSYRKEAEAMKLNLAAGTCSDHIALLRAFEGYREARLRGRQACWSYCKENFLSSQSFDQMDQMRLHFAELMANIGFLKVNTSSRHSRQRSPSGKYDIFALEDAIYEQSQNSSTLELLRAILCSGIFPSIALVTKSGKRPSFLTLEDGTVRPHMVSVNSTVRFFPHRWLIYTDKVQTGGILFRNSTMVTDLALLLFGGDLEISLDDPCEFSILNGQFLFKADPGVPDVVSSLRCELQSLLERKIRDPKTDIFEEGGSIVGAVMTLLSNEQAPNVPKTTSLYDEAMEDAMDQMLMH